MEIFSQIGQMLAILSVLVILHEFGHYLPAKLFGVKVEKFFLFFDVKFALFRKKIGETVYGIGWLPLGGYVKLAGMIDESMDKEQMKRPAQDYEFRSKPAWQRLIIMLGGVVINFLIAIFIFAGLLYTNGKTYLPIENAKYGIVVDSVGANFGLQNGDKILEINGEKPKTLRDARLAMVTLNEGEKIRVDRLGTEQEIEVSLAAVQDGNAVRRAPNAFFYLRVPAIIGYVAEDLGGAKKAGLLAGDEILAVNGEEITFFDEYREIMSSFADNEVELTIRRGDKIKDIAVNLTTVDGRKMSGILGPQAEQEQKLFDYEVQTYSLLSAIPAGAGECWSLLKLQVDKMGQMFSPETGAWKQMGSLISVTKVINPEWNTTQFFTMMALLSLILGFMNLLPIPALDGGHALFCILEIIMGRPLPEKVMEVIQTVGVVILLSLMVLVLGWDVVKNFFY